MTQRSSTRAACLLVGIVLVGGVVYFSVMGHGSHQNTPPPTTLKKLDYQTLTPYGKPTEQLGGWHRVSPPKATPVYAYTDTIDSVSITVSQQPLPDKFIEGTDAELAELAKNFNATNEIKANGVKVYVGTSSKGPQSALFIKSGLLILIKSQSKINDDAWARYAESLR